MMDSTNGPSGMAVSGLMQQLKSGEISKMQLFQQIAQLQAATSNTSSNTTVPPPPPSIAATNILSMAQKQQTTLPSTSSDTATNIFGATRPSLLNQINTQAPAPVHPTPYQSLFQGTQPMENNVDGVDSGVSHDNAQRLSVQEWMANKKKSIASTEPPTIVSLQSSRPSVVRSESLLQQTAQPYGSSTPSMLFSLLRQQQSEVVSNQGLPGSIDKVDMNSKSLQDVRYEDETVHPDLYSYHNDKDPVTTSNNGNHTNEDKFHARVTRWKSQKEALREQLKQQLLQSELDECTFTPKVNPKSTKVITRLRKTMRAKSEIEIPTSVSERLYQEADNYKAREELAAKIRAEDEHELQRECTFKPKTNKGHPMNDKVQAKYMIIPKKDTPVITPAAMEAAAKEFEECTFNPKVNGINSQMVSAQLYIQQNIYDRLSRPCGISNGSQSVGRYSSGQRSLFGDDTESDMTDMLALVSPNTRRCQDDLYVRTRRRRSSQAVQIQPSSCDRPRPRSAGGDISNKEKAERAEQFENFLERQRFHEQSRKKKMEMTLQQLEFPHRPSINKKSLMMMENGRKGDFLERITKYAIQKEHDSVKKKTIGISDPHCTFKPSINNHSAKRQGRSVTELSRGDLLRRETSQRLMKLRMEQEEMTSLTFRPQLNRVSQRVEGRLNILSSPETYLQRIQQQRQAHTLKQRRAVQEKEMEEFAECTFKPRTIEAPAYVHRIAKSVSLNKAIKKQQEAAAKSSVKPEWK